MSYQNYRQSEVFSITTITLSIGVIGIVIGLTIPIVALRLNVAGINGTIIGLISAAPAMGMLIVSPFARHIVQWVGKRLAMLFATIISALSLIPLMGSLSLELLFPLRLLTGIASGVMICLGETWINELSPDNKRGRILAVYTTVFTISQLVGPSIIAIYGISDKTPILLSIFIHLISVILFLMMDQKKGDKLPKNTKEPSFSIIYFIKVAPAICGGILFFAFFDGTVLSMFPIYGLNVGHTEAIAAMMISAILAGDAIMQIPFGWLADNMNRTRLYRICGVVTLFASLLLPITMPHTLLIWPLLLILGATAGAIYTIALVQIGQYFSGNNLMVANASAAMLWGIGNLSGPLLSGVLSEISPSLLPFLLVIMVGLFLVSTMNRFNAGIQTQDSHSL